MAKPPEPPKPLTFLEAYQQLPKADPEAANRNDRVDTLYRLMCDIDFLAVEVGMPLESTADGDKLTITGAAGTIIVFLEMLDPELYSVASSGHAQTGSLSRPQMIHTVLQRLRLTA